MKKAYFAKTAKVKYCFFTFTGHMIHSSIESGSRGRDAAGATTGPTASHDSSKVEQLILTFFCEMMDCRLEVPEIRAVTVRFQS